MGEVWTFDPNGTALTVRSTGAMRWRDPGLDFRPSWKTRAAETVEGEGEPELIRTPGNVEISGTLEVRNVTGTDVEDALHNLGALADRARTETLEVKRVLDSAQGGSTVYYDLEAVELADVAETRLVTRSDIELPVTMRALPYNRGAEQTKADHAETTLPALVFTDSTIPGQVPALGRLVIDNDSTSQDQRFVCGGVQSRYYSTAETAALFYQAEHLDPLGAAATSASTSLWSEGSFSGSGYVKSTNLSPTWSGVLENLISTGALSSTTPSYMTNVGTYRAWARVFQPSGNSTGVRLRLDWSPGDALNMSENDPWGVTVENDASLVDLGLITIAEPQQGSDRWVGRIQAQADTPGDDIYIDYLALIPADEGYFEVRTPLGLDTPAEFSARSEFNTESGAITGDSLVVGRTWNGAGDADDFSVVSSAARRTAVSDADNHGRICTASSPTLAAVAVQADVKNSAANGAAGGLGVVARFVDTSNYFRARLSTGTQPQFQVSGYLAGSEIALSEPAVSYTPGTTITVALLIDAAGHFKAWLFPVGSSPGEPLVAGQHSALATGGALDDGKVGIHDVQNAATASNRDYDNFAAWVPGIDVAIPSAQSLEWRHDGALREDEAGDVWVSVAADGDLAYPPASGREARTMRTIVMASRGDPRSGEADSGIDDISARWSVQPRYLTIPKS